MEAKIRRVKSNLVVETEANLQVVGGVGAQEIVNVNEVGHVIETGRGGADHVTGTGNVAEVGAVLATGTDEIRGGATSLDLVPGKAGIARPRRWKRRNGRDRKRERGRERTTRVEGERSHFGGTLPPEGLNTSLRYSTRLCKVFIMT